MGIKTLTAYVRKNGHFNNVKFKEVARNKIVIDGFALCYALHRRIKCGDYYEFYDKVVEFFKWLKSIEVEAYVVIDGIDYENVKAATSKDRLSRRLMLLNKSNFERREIDESFLPSFARVVFVDALRENGDVKFFVADGGADRDIVSLANHLGCPVLTDDSDFFIFSVEYGVIMLPKRLNNLVYTKVEFFDYEEFVRNCKFPHSQTRLFLPYCLGNDFNKSHKLVINKHVQIEEKANVDDVFDVLIESSLTVDQYRAELDSYFKYYEVVSKPFKDLFQSSVFSQHAIPQSIVLLYKKGEFSHDAMHFLIDVKQKVWRYVMMFEDLAKDSAWAVTDSVLKYIIGALLSCGEEDSVLSVVVPRRQPLAVDSVCIEIEPMNFLPLIKPCHLDILKYHSLDTVCDMSKVDRQNIFFHVFQYECEHIAESLASIPEDLKLIVIVSRCWLRAISENSDHRFKAFVVTLVLCLPKCYDPSERRCYSPNEMTALDRIHYLAQWECMLYLANIFNQILGYPFTYASLGRLFSATRFLDYFAKNPDLLFMDLSDIGRAMYGAITEGVLPEAPPLSHQASPRQQGIVMQNRYELLASEEV